MVEVVIELGGADLASWQYGFCGLGLALDEFAEGHQTQKLQQRHHEHRVQFNVLSMRAAVVVRRCRAPLSCGGTVSRCLGGWVWPVCVCGYAQHHDDSRLDTLRTRCVQHWTDFRIPGAVSADAVVEQNIPSGQSGCIPAKSMDSPSPPCPAGC